MRQSKLESYESILEALINRPLTFEQIAYESNVEVTSLKRYLEFLMKNELIQERMLSKKKQYALTERGIAVFRALNFQKYLGKIKNTIRAIDEAMQAIPNISEHDHKSAEG